MRRRPTPTRRQPGASLPRCAHPGITTTPTLRWEALSGIFWVWRPSRCPPRGLLPSRLWRCMLRRAAPRCPNRTAVLANPRMESRGTHGWDPHPEERGLSRLPRHIGRCRKRCRRWQRSTCREASRRAHTSIRWLLSTARRCRASSNRTQHYGGHQPAGSFPLGGGEAPSSPSTR